MCGAYKHVVRGGHCGRRDSRSLMVRGGAVFPVVWMRDISKGRILSRPLSFLGPTQLLANSRLCHTFSLCLGRNFYVFHKLLNSLNPISVPLPFLWTPVTHPPVSASAYGSVTLRLSACPAPLQSESLSRCNAKSSSIIISNTYPSVSDTEGIGMCRIVGWKEALLTKPL